MRVFNAHIVWNIAAQNVYCEITWGTMVCFKQQIFMKTFNRSTHLLWSVMNVLALVRCDFPICYVLHSILLAKWGKPSTRLLTWYYKWGIDSEQLVNLTNDPLAYHRECHTIGMIENVGVKFSFQDFSMLDTSPYTFVWKYIQLDVVVFVAVNNVKCKYCNMTCPNASALKQHVKFRHSEERPFKCDVCSYT